MFDKDGRYGAGIFRYAPNPKAFLQEVTPFQSSGSQPGAPALTAAVAFALLASHPCILR